MSDQDRIRLAEAMGWRWKPSSTDNKIGRWYRPDGNYGDWVHKGDLPFDPFTDANDDYALIRWLNEQGFAVTILTGRDGDDVFVFPFDHEYTRWEQHCDDWKQGVCELALKVIDND